MSVTLYTENLKLLVIVWNNSRHKTKLFTLVKLVTCSFWEVLSNILHDSYNQELIS